jgi:hypothetical protein
MMDSLALNQFVSRSLASVMVLSVAYIIASDSCVGEASWESQSAYSKRIVSILSVYSCRLSLSL